MRALLVFALATAWLAVGCSGPRSRPPLPAPEYERPAVSSWDAGKQVDPLEEDGGDWVDDDDGEPPAPPPDAGPAASDAGNMHEAGP